MSDNPMNERPPVNEFGAKWCPTHGRYECARRGRHPERGHHGVPVRGTDSCRHCAGVSLEQQKAKGAANMAMAEASSLAERLDPARRRHPGEVLLDAVHNVDALALQVRADIVEADGVPTPESLARLVEASKLAGHLAETALRVDSTDRWVRAREQVVTRDASGVEAFVRGVVERLGHSWDDERVRAAVVAELEAAEAVGA